MLNFSASDHLVLKRLIVRFDNREMSVQAAADENVIEHLRAAVRPGSVAILNWAMRRVPPDLVHRRETAQAVGSSEPENAE